MLLCRALGHRLQFSARGKTLFWTCERGCGEGGGEKGYPTAEQARRLARAFDRRDSDDVGRRAPLIGLLPLRLWRKLRGEQPRGRG